MKELRSNTFNKFIILLYFYLCQGGIVFTTIYLFVQLFVSLLVSRITQIPLVGSHEKNHQMGLGQTLIPVNFETDLDYWIQQKI